MDTAQWPQEIVVKPIEEIVTNTCPKPSPPAAAAAASSTLNNNNLDRKPRPQKEQALNCPRCNSTNTKFCYYNNYSLTQPRYFCKTCRRYWTEGGSLRNIPVGGGSRKNKRSSSSSSSTSSLQSPSPSSLISSSCTSTTSVVSSSSRKLPDLITPQNYAKVHDHNPHHHHGQDLNLSFPSTTIHHDFKTISELVQVPSSNHLSLSSSAPCSSSALELLSGITANNTTRGSLGAFMSMPPPLPDPGSVYTPGFVLPEFKPTLGFSLDGGIGGGGDQGFRSALHGVQDHSASSTGGGRLLFPFEDLKQQGSSTNHEDVDQNREQADSNGYWAGMLGGSGSW